MFEHRRCTVCIHLRHEAIEKAHAHGRPLRLVAKKYHLTKSALHRHKHYSKWRFPALAFPNFFTEHVRGNPDKTKPFRWEPGEWGDEPESADV
jgi:hypothetical protein